MGYHCQWTFALTAGRLAFSWLPSEVTDFARFVAVDIGRPPIDSPEPLRSRPREGRRRLARCFPALRVTPSRNREQQPDNKTEANRLICPHAGTITGSEFRGQAAPVSTCRRRIAGV